MYLGVRDGLRVVETGPEDAVAIYEPPCGIVFVKDTTPIERITVLFYVLHTYKPPCTKKLQSMIEELLRQVVPKTC